MIYCLVISAIFRATQNRKIRSDRGVHSFDHHSDKVQCVPWTVKKDGAGQQGRDKVCLIMVNACSSCLLIGINGY